MVGRDAVGVGGWSYGAADSAERCPCPDREGPPGRGGPWSTAGQVRGKWSEGGAEADQLRRLKADAAMSAEQRERLRIEQRVKNEMRGRP